MRAILAAAAILTTVQVQADEPTHCWLGHEIQIREGNGSNNRVNGLITRKFTEQWGVSAFFLHTDDGYGEVYIGPTFSPAPWIELSAGIGYQNADDPVVVGGSIFIVKDQISFLGILEVGDSLWYRTRLAKELENLPGVGIGTMSETGLGIGPYLEWKIPDTPLKVWGTTLIDVFDGNNVNGIIGCQISW